ncbi:hypothetical protein E6C76_13395 [Pseudothauera nasutitermitis]|uniref:SH3b domain-containing protein n=1 Tax=Pseudothauera nasutitermitis TaxID=2565930 RepID=A0A4S4AUF7_9RHOO|nr:SH3 domain-containing protein [Pseudothauera nasutitermitis]THF63587.1 hypothetical protein E6C76_13395 [Pseudothauera nasutitermitis]
MSLINDMLRDIDRRGVQASGEHHAVLDDTVIVPALRTRRWPPAWALLLSVGAVLCALAAWLLYGQQSGIGRPLPEPVRLAAALAEAQTAPPAEPATPVEPAEPAAPEQPAAPSEPDAPAPDPATGAEPTVPAAEAPQSSAAESQPAPSATASTPPPPAEPAPRIADAGQPVYILPGKRVNLRTGPALNAEVLHVISARSPLVLTDRANDFLGVRTQGGVSGWISAEFAQVGGVPPAATVAEPAAPALAAHPVAVPATPATRPGTRPEDARALHTEALRALERGQAAAAEASLLDALRADPRFAPALNTLSALLLQQGRRAELEARLTELARQGHPDATAATLRARLQAEDGNPTAGLSLLEALPADRLNGEQLVVLATLRQRVGRHEDAVDAYRRALELGQRGGATWAGLAASLDMLGSAAEARQAWQAALAAGPLGAALERHARARLAALGGPGD